MWSFYTFNNKIYSQFVIALLEKLEPITIEKNIEIVNENEEIL
jgi:hypothetical protein